MLAVLRYCLRYSAVEQRKESERLYKACMFEVVGVADVLRLPTPSPQNPGATPPGRGTSCRVYLKTIIELKLGGKALGWGKHL